MSLKLTTYKAVKLYNYSQQVIATTHVCIKSPLTIRASQANQGLLRKEIALSLGLRSSIRNKKNYFATSYHQSFFNQISTENLQQVSMASPYFEFEQDFVGTLRCIPMSVRHSLDTCGVKLKLEHWNKFTPDERTALVEWPCDTPAAVVSYRDRLQALITQRSGTPAKTLDTSPTPPWQNLSTIPGQVADKFQSQNVPLSLQQWQALSELQRFALIKLSRPSHENNNFMPAVYEFGLANT